MEFTKAGVTKTSTVSQIIKPVRDVNEAVSVQQQALNSVTSSSVTESTAISKQSGVLGNFDSIHKQQAMVETAHTVQRSQIIVAQAAGTNVQGAAQEDQIKALSTVENREKLLSAVQYGVDMWRLQAHFRNIQIMGQTAIGVPGCLQGPELTPWITQAPSVYNTTGYFRVLSNAVADAVNKNFNEWKDMVTVPGLPWYPMFVAVAAPFAPPTPNIPMPLMACVSQNFNKLASPYQIELVIKNLLPDEMKIVEMDMFIYMLSVHLSNYFLSWLSSQNVMMVMGMGPVPTFNPPYVPVGPVVNGYVIPSPGHLVV